MAVGVEYIREILGNAPTVPKTATAFQEGQKTAADIGLLQYQQQAYEQAARFREMQQPYVMAEKQRAEEQAAEGWRREQEAFRLDQEARLRNPQLAPPGMGPMPSSGAYAVPTLQVGAPGTTSTNVPPGLVQAESGGRTDLINQYGYGGRLQFGQDRLNDAIAAGFAPQGTTVQAFAQSPRLQQQVEAWHFNDINNYIQREGLGKYVGQTVGGTVVTPQGMLAAAHLGGKAGLKQFLESGGKYNPADQLGTTLSSYMGRFGGVTAPSYVPSMANVPMPGQGYGAPTGLGSIGIPQAGAMPSFQGLPLSSGGVPMAMPEAERAGTTLSSYLTIGGLADAAGGFASTLTGRAFMPLLKLGNYFFGSPETGAQLDRTSSESVAARNWYNSAAVIDALSKRPELLQEAQQNPFAFYRKYSSAIQPSEQPTTPQVGVSETGSIFTGLPLSERPIANALSNIFGGTTPAAVAPGAMPTGSLLPAPTPTPAAPVPTAPTPTAPATETESIFQRPGLQTGETVGPFSLKTMGDITASEDAMRRKAAALETNYRIAQARGDYAKTEAIRTEFANLQTEGEALRRLKAVQTFEMGDPRDMQYQIFEMSKGRLKLQPRSDGKYNLLLDNKVNREGVSKEQLAAEMRSSFDSEFKALVAEQRKAQLELQKKTVEAGLDIYKETKKQSAQQLREITNKLAELQYKRDNPRVRLEKTQDGAGFIEYDEAGNIRAYLTTEPEIGVDGKPVLVNPADPKSGPRYRISRSPFANAVPTR